MIGIQIDIQVDQIDIQWVVLGVMVEATDPIMVSTFYFPFYGDCGKLYDSCKLYLIYENY